MPVEKVNAHFITQTAEENFVVKKVVQRRTRLKGEQRREQIIRTATEVFAHHGFRGATVRQLAREAGISEAMIYQHFPSKGALYDAILEKKMERTKHLYFPTDAARTKQDRSVLETIIANFLREQTEDNAFMRMLLFSALEGHDLARKFVRKPLQDFFNFLGAYLEAGMKDGTMKPVNGQVAGRLLLGMAHFLVLLREIYRDPGIKDVGIEDLGRLIVDIFCNGIMEG
jgi:AcrR family transcriptional regulator